MRGSTGTIFDELEQLGTGSGFRAVLADMLEGADMFRDFSRQDVEQLAAYVAAYAAPRGTKVLAEGGRESYMFIVASGRVDIFKHPGDQAKETKIATVRAGKSIGEMAVVDGLPHSATAVVAEEAKLILITQRNLDQLVEHNPALGAKFLRRLCALMSLRLRQTSGVLIDYIGK
ncbi:MAG TPA: cyclic nucleotide-binding domain-containing protein [Candidatus Tenderia sp.]|nr:cyclic nucleotide-binding domain-containing protein [Candidatus Tenderia sp.]